MGVFVGKNTGWFCHYRDASQVGLVANLLAAGRLDSLAAWWTILELLSAANAYEQTDTLTVVASRLTSILHFKQPRLLDALRAIMTLSSDELSVVIKDGTSARDTVLVIRVHKWMKLQNLNKTKKTKVQQKPAVELQLQLQQQLQIQETNNSHAAEEQAEEPKTKYREPPQEAPPEDDDPPQLMFGKKKGGGSVPDLAGGETENFLQETGVKKRVQRLWLEQYPDAAWIQSELGKAREYFADKHYNPAQWTAKLGDWLKRGWKDHKTPTAAPPEITPTQLEEFGRVLEKAFGDKPPASVTKKLPVLIRALETMDEFKRELEGCMVVAEAAMERRFGKTFQKKVQSSAEWNSDLTSAIDKLLWRLK